MVLIKIVKITWLLILCNLGFMNQVRANDEPYRACRDFMRESSFGVREVSQPDGMSMFVVNGSHSNLKTIVKEVLKIQKSLIAAKEHKSEDLKSGFLVGSMSEEFLVELLHRPDSEAFLVCADVNGADKLAGYGLLTDLSEFETYFKDNEQGVVTPSIPEDSWEDVIRSKSILYIDQVGVLPSLRRMGIGKILLKEIKRSHPDGLVADILYWPNPFVNEASYRFFTKKQGFVDIGCLHQFVGSSIGECKTHIVAWPQELAFSK